MSVTRTYMCQTHGVVFEAQQRISEPPLAQCQHCSSRKCVPKRLIDLGPEPHLISGPTGGWSETGYSKRPHERRAEAKLGRKLIKSEK